MVRTAYKKLRPVREYAERTLKTIERRGTSAAMSCQLHGVTVTAEEEYICDVCRDCRLVSISFALSHVCDNGVNCHH